MIATVAAYAIARLEFPGKKLILSLALAIAMFPAVSLVGPLFDIWRSIGRYDTWLGLIIPYMSFTLPLSIWTLSAFFPRHGQPDQSRRGSRALVRRQPDAPVRPGQRGEPHARLSSRPA